MEIFLQKFEQMGGVVEAFVEGEIKDNLIAPLLLLPFLENAFKHGVATDKRNPIVINVEIETGKLLFKVVNKKNNLNKDATGGIGLLNVQRRLDLVYKDKYSLLVDNKADSYSCILNLNL